MELTSLEKLLKHELLDLHDAENRIVEALPKMAGAAHHPDLKEAFNEHLKETRHHVERLERIFGIMKIQSNGVTCEATKGLIKEGSEIVEASGDPNVKDAALIGAAQRVEHYEMAAYGTARALAKQLGLDEVADLLDETLEEEASADKKLTKLAEGGFGSEGINQEAEAVHS